MNGKTKHTSEELAELKAKPLEEKIQISIARIMEWYNYWGGNVAVSFSGGKDSTVLLHLVRSVYPDVKAMFINTGLEYPEIQSFARGFDNVDIVRPEMMFNDVITKYGYPLISKEVAEKIFYARNSTLGKGKEAMTCRAELTGCRMYNTGGQNVYSMFNKKKWLQLTYIPIPISNRCCSIMKKSTSSKYETRTKLRLYIGTTTEESMVRKQAWLKTGCNAFDGVHPKSQPLSFWTEQDMLKYIRQNDLSIAPVYGDIVEDGNALRCSGCDRTGCIFCGFGLHLEKGETRFQRLAKTHPKHYDYCMRGGQWVDNPDYKSDAPEYDGTWKNYNPKQIWVPSKDGLGMRKVFDMVNEVYGKDFCRYE